MRTTTFLGLILMVILGGFAYKDFLEAPHSVVDVHGTADTARHTLHTRAERLQRGVNVSRWFRFPLNESDDYFSQYLSDDDLSLMTQAGFTHVRLAIAPQYIYDASSTTRLDTRMLPFIDKAINKILSHKLAVVVDLHDEDKIFEGAEGARDLVIFWRNFARQLSHFDPNYVYFELLNEPRFEGRETEWLSLQDQLIATVHEEAPRHTIIATGADWGGIDGLLSIKPSADQNVIYSFHYYEPSAFTHQGADWAGDAYPSIAHLRYPFQKENCDDVLARVTTQNARDLVHDYCADQWHKDTIENDIKRAVDWSHAYDVPVFVGEFGAYCKQTPASARLKWLADVKNIFDTYHIGWTLWAYDDCFGLETSQEVQNGRRDLDAKTFAIFSTTTLPSALEPSIPAHNQKASAPWTRLIGAPWQWQLSGTIDTSVSASAYDIDYESNARIVQALHAKGIKVICYINMGAWEAWRPDANQFPQSTIGNDDEGWPGERWLDIRQIDSIGPLLRGRLDTCKEKGFDAVEPDNVQGYQENTGFPLTYSDQIAFNTWLAQEAHKRGLLIGLKNDADQVPDLILLYDFAITEDCFAQGWCSRMNPFIIQGKPVFAAEYGDTGVTISAFCSEAKILHFNGILKHRSLDAYRESCGE